MADYKYSFDEYMDSSKKLFKQLFGTELYNKLKRRKIKSIEWKGIDLDCTGSLATFPDIKSRFSPGCVESFNEKGMPLLDLYLMTVFHYGYQQCNDVAAEPNRKMFIEMAELNQSLLNTLKDVREKGKKV